MRLITHSLTHSLTDLLTLGFIGDVQGPVNTGVNLIDLLRMRFD